MLELIIPIAFGLTIVVLGIMFALRRVVSPNEVHVIQSSSGRKSFGKDGQKNTYYEVPAFVPFFGVTKTVLPVSNFDLSVKHYPGYDLDRVPFVVDIIAFFRIENTDLASQRVESYYELKDQLLKIMQGAIRTVLASEKIDNIMLERSTFGQKFTDEVEEQLKQWGVETVKNMELLDIQDAEGSNVIFNIMAKKKSHIEMESRREVAENKQLAEIAEIKNAKIADVAGETARQEVAERKALADKGIGVATEKAKQEIQEQARITTEKQMAVLKVEEVRKAEIRMDVEVIDAENDKKTTVIVADGSLEEQKKVAESIEIVGVAKATAEREMLMAPVSAEIALAEKIAQLDGYQDYLVNIKTVEANKTVGVETAKALEKSELKVIANSGDVTGGMNSLMDLFTSKGGTSLGASLDAFANTDNGKALLEKFGMTKAQAKELLSEPEPKTVGKPETKPKK